MVTMYSNWPVLSAIGRPSLSGYSMVGFGRAESALLMAMESDRDQDWLSTSPDKAGALKSWEQEAAWSLQAKFLQLLGVNGGRCPSHQVASFLVLRECDHVADICC